MWGRVTVHSILFTALAILLTMSGAVAQQCGPSGMSGPLPLPDAKTIEDTVYLTAAPDQIITNLEVSLSLTHEFLADLWIELQSPAGRVVPLLQNRCPLSNSIDITFSDSSALLTCQDSLTGYAASPDGQLSDLLFEPAAGAWILRITDQYQGDTGVLSEWCILPVIESAPCQVPTQVEITSLTVNSLEVSWQDGAPPVSGLWNLEVRNALSGQLALPVLSVDTTTATVTGLSPATAYQIRVRTLCASDTSSWSTPTHAATRLPNPSPCPTILPIPDNACERGNMFEIMVDSAPGVSLGSDVYLSALKLGVEHLWLADLDISLTSPQGSTVVISSDNGGSGDHLGIPTDSTCQVVTTFSSSSCDPVSVKDGVAPFLGTYAPEQSLEGLNDGNSPIGIWTLTICDDSGDDAGFLRYAELVFRPLSCAPPEELFVQSSGPDSLSLSWESPPNCSGFILEYGPPGSPPGTDSVPGSGASSVVFIPCPAPQPFVLGGLDERTEYEITLRAVCSVGGFSENACPIITQTLCRTAAITAVETFDDQGECGNSCLDKCQLTGLWNNVPSDGLDWLVNSGPTPSPKTGPESGLNGYGRYVYLEASDPCAGSDVAVLQSNCLTVDAPEPGCHFSFHTYMSGEDAGALRLEVSPNSGVSWLPLFEIEGDQGLGWNRHYIDLSVFNKDTIQLRFVGSKGDGPFGDIALDELVFFGVSDLGPPQVPVYPDADGDGFGSDQGAILICRDMAPAGFVFLGGDCNDDNPDINPASEELPCNGIDENCNGLIDDLPIPPPLTSGDSVCFGKEATLTGVSGFGGVLYWFETINSPNPIDTGIEISVLPDMDRVYFVSEQVLAKGCMSIRVPVTVKVFPQPNLVVPDSLIWCEGQEITIDDLIVTDAGGTGLFPQWYVSYPISSSNVFDNPVTVNEDRIFPAVLEAPGGCSDTAFLSVQADPYPAVVIPGPDTVVLCSGKQALIGSEVTYTGDQSLHYLWTGGFTETELAIVGSSQPGSGTAYGLTVTTTTGCMASDTVIAITEPALSLISVQSVEPVSICGASDGRIEVTVLNGQPPYTMTWEGPVSGQTIGSSMLVADFLPQGAYRLTVTDQSGANCPFALPIQVIDGPQIQVNAVSIEPESCPGTADGSIALNIAGGAPDILWSTGSTNATIENLNTGFYSVTLSDINCQLTLDSLEVTAPFPLELVNSLSTPVRCYGGADGSVSISADGGTLPYQVSWSDGQQGLQRSDLTGGLYQFTLTDSRGCSIIEAIEVHEPPSLDFYFSQFLPISCFGNSDGRISIAPQGGVAPYTIDWSDGSSLFDRVDLPVGMYGFTLKDEAGCEAFSGPVELTGPDSLTLVIDSLRPASCNAAEDGYLRVKAEGGTPGYAFIWDIGFSGPVLSQLPADTYGVRVIDANGCFVDSDPILVPGPQILSFSPAQITNPTCIGRNDGILELIPSGGQPPYTQEWSTGNTGPMLDGLSAGMYSCTLTDVNGCELVSQVFELVQPQVVSLSIDAIHDARCAGNIDGSLFLSVAGGLAPYAYIWSDGSTQQDRTQLGAGTYSVTVSDLQGCRREANQLSIHEPEPIDIQVVNIEHVVCSGQENGSIDILPTGGTPPYTFSWNTTATTEDISGLPEGVYKTTVLDKNGCALTSDPLVVTEPPPLEVEVISVEAVNCNGGDGGSADVEVSGGEPPYTYAWSDGSTQQDLMQVTAGIYSLIVSDLRNCKTILPALQITNPTDSFFIEIDSIRPVTCFGSSDGYIGAQISGGQPPYEFLWNTGNDSSLVIQGAKSGKYTLTAADANGCQAFSSIINLQNPPPLSVAIDSIVQPSCNGELDGQIYITASGAGGFRYAWLDGVGDTVSTERDLSGAGAGEFRCLIADSFGCEVYSVPVSLTWPAPPMISVVQIHPSCPGDSTGSVSVSASGGKPGYSFAWNHGAIGPLATQLGTGIYSVTLTDASGCTVISDDLFVPVKPGEPLKDSLNIVEGVSCHGGNDGRIELHISGGISPYTVLWSHGDTGQEVEALFAGMYQATVTDFQGCSVMTDVATLNEPAEPLQWHITELVDNVCPGTAEGVIEIEIDGGMPPYSLVWNTGATGSSLSSLTEGYYQVQVIDDNGCEFLPPPIYVDGPPPFQIGLSVQPSSPSAPTGKASVAVIGGSPPYTFLWDAAAGSQDSSVAVQLAPGSYTLSITDFAGCDTSVTVEIPLATSISDLTTHTWVELMPNPTDGQVTLQVTTLPKPMQTQIAVLDARGTPVHVLDTVLQSGATLELSFHGLPSGVYFMVLTDKSGGETQTFRIVKIPR